MVVILVLLCCICAFLVPVVVVVVGLHVELARARVENILDLARSII